MTIEGVRGLPEGALVVEEWQIVDRWWSENPFVQKWRMLALADGVFVNQRLDDDDVWREHRTQ